MKLWAKFAVTKKILILHFLLAVRYVYSGFWIDTKFNTGVKILLFFYSFVEMYLHLLEIKRLIYFILIEILPDNASSCEWYISREQFMQRNDELGFIRSKELSHTMCFFYQIWAWISLDNNYIYENKTCDYKIIEMFVFFSRKTK